MKISEHENQSSEHKITIKKAAHILKNKRQEEKCEQRRTARARRNRDIVNRKIMMPDRIFKRRRRYQLACRKGELEV